MKGSRTRRVNDAKQTVDNGVNLEAAVDAQLDDKILHITWQANCEWITGVYVRSTVDGHAEPDGAAVRSKKFSVAADYPELLAGEDRAPTPIELVLSALASCLTGGVAITAQYRGIRLRYIETIAEGTSDVRGTLAREPGNHNRNSMIAVSFVIDADATLDEIEGLVAEAQERSAVLKLLGESIDVVVDVK